jgi:DUF4097 and DUF4098 domain-containing protein YvlB
MRAAVFTCVFVLMMIVAGGCSFNSPRAQVTQQLAAEHLADTAIVVDSRNGGVDILGDAAVEQVKIEARLTCGGKTQEEADQRLADSSIDISRSIDRSLVIKPIFAGGARNGDGASFTIQIPDARGVTVNTSNGRVGIRHLRGRAEIGTSNGSVTIVDHDGNAIVDTSNGSVTAAQLSGTLTVDTSNGSVEARQIGGPVEIQTSNGSIRLVQNPDAIGPFHLRTSNGSIKATIGSRFAGAVSMDTSNGPLSIHDPTGRITSSRIDGNDGSITIGDGGTESKIATSNGRIELEIVN